MATNVFLFLYPIKEYLTTRTVSQFKESGFRIEHLGNIIHTRYRSRGWKVYWVLFSSPLSSHHSEGLLVPDYGQISTDMQGDTADTFIACGIRFQEHVVHKKYPDPSYILNQLPTDTSQIVLGGFHQWDCVSKVAEAAYMRNIPVMVDEDTTDHFFGTTANRGSDIPLDRSYMDGAFELARDLATHPPLLEGAIERRIGKPWFIPLPLVPPTLEVEEVPIK